MPTLKESKMRRPNFNTREISHMIHCVSEIQPLSMVEWEQVAQLHSDEYSDLLRTAEALKRKFNAIIKKAPPTGNPECPQYVRDALIARRLIIEKTEASDGGSDLDRSSNFDDSDDDEEEDDYDADESSLFAEDVEVEEGDTNVVAQLAMSAAGNLNGVETTEITDEVAEMNENAPVISVPPLGTNCISQVGAQFTEDLSNLVPQSSTAFTPSPRISKLSTSSLKKCKVERGAKSSTILRFGTGSSSDEVLGAKHLPATKEKLNRDQTP